MFSPQSLLLMGEGDFSDQHVKILTPSSLSFSTLHHLTNLLVSHLPTPTRGKLWVLSHTVYPCPQQFLEELALMALVSMEGAEAP